MGLREFLSAGVPNKHYWLWISWYCFYLCCESVATCCISWLCCALLIQQRRPGLCSASLSDTSI